MTQEPGRPKPPAGDRALRVIAVLATIAAAVGAIAVLLNGDAGKPTPTTITIHVDGRDSDTRPDDPLPVPKAAVDQAQQTELGNHDGLKTETPPGVPAEVIEVGREQQDRLAERDDLPVVTPLAAPSQRGCRSTFVVNHSSRRGVRPRLFVVHYTVSPNRAGWSDVNGVVALFNRPSFAASSNYVIDGEGHCAYIVRESDKAWTQATFNPVAISIEVINSGRETRLADDPGLRKIGLVISDATRRWGIPLQRGAVSGCTVTRPGIVDHATLGQCGGGHVDIRPYPLDPVIAAANAARGDKPVPAFAKATCRRLQWWRTHGRPSGRPRANAIRRRKALERRHLTCTARGPVRAT